MNAILKPVPKNLYTLSCSILLLFLVSFPLAAQEEEEEKERKINKNGLHFFHQYSLEHSFAEFNNNGLLKGKTALSSMPFFGVGLKRETANFVFAFSSRFGIQRDNMTFSYAGKKIAGTYCMDYVSVRRQFALGFRITPQQTFSFLFISSFNIPGMGATPFGEKLNLRKLEQKDKVQLSVNEDPFWDGRLGFEYELKPMVDEKLRLFFILETSLKQRHVDVARNSNLGIDQPYTLFYRFSAISFGLRF